MLVLLRLFGYSLTLQVSLSRDADLLDADEYVDAEQLVEASNQWRCSVSSEQ